MSVFSNPASRAPETAHQYVTAILDLLGERDARDVLSSTAGRLRDMVTGRAPQELLDPEAPGKWSATEVLQHLADSDLVWAYRLRMVIAEDRPTLVGYDQDRWAARLWYRDTTPKEALEQFAWLRVLNLRLLSRLTPEDLGRVSIHSERGEETAAHMIRLYAGHDLVHLRQLERILASRA